MRSRKVTPPVALVRYFAGTPAQLASLRDANIVSVHGLFQCVRQHFHEDALGTNPASPSAVYKRHVICYMKRFCRGAFVDFERLVENGVIVRGGKYPDQWLAMQGRPSLVESTALPRRSPRLADLNAGYDDESALAEDTRYDAHSRHF